MAAVNYAEMYQQALQQKFSVGVRFSRLYSTPNNTRIRWVNAKTVQIPTITVGGFVDVDRDVVGDYTRRVDNQWSAKTLEHDREFKTLVDPMDIDETNMALTIANITQVFNDEEKFPEFDKYMASKLHAEYTGLGGVPDTTVATVGNILDIFDDMMQEMDDDEVPQDGRLLYVTPEFYKLLKNADKVQRTLEVRGESAAVNRNVRSLDEVELIRVPSSRMKTAYDFTDGAVADPTAKQINMILIHPMAIIAPSKYDFVDLDEPAATTGGKWLYYERVYWDVFAIEQKLPGIKIHEEGEEEESGGE